MLEVTMLVIFYLTPWFIFVQQCVRIEQDDKGYCSLRLFLFFIACGVLPGANILFMLMALSFNKVFDKKLFVKDK